eukprot:scaffold7738_cov133-Cylindrotheca_fusiformis.AAC.22
MPDVAFSLDDFDVRDHELVLPWALQSDDDLVQNQPPVEMLLLTTQPTTDNHKWTTRHSATNTKVESFVFLIRKSHVDFCAVVGVTFQGSMKCDGYLEVMVGEV